MFKDRQAEDSVIIPLQRVCVCVVETDREDWVWEKNKVICHMKERKREVSKGEVRNKVQMDDGEIEAARLPPSHLSLNLILTRFI